MNPRNGALAAQLGVPPDALLDTLKRLPHMTVEEGKRVNGSSVVTWHNWRKYQEDSTVSKRVADLRSKRRGEERRREENKKASLPSPSPVLSSTDEQPPWGTPQALLALYNASMPTGHPRATDLRGKRLEKTRRYLRLFPEREFWEVVFREIGQSRLLRGLKPSPGHEHFRADFDWLLSAGKDGTDNCVKVREGRYRDQEEEAYGFER